LAKGKEWGRIVCFDKSEQTLEGQDWAKASPGDVRDRDLEGRPFKLRSFGEQYAKDGTPLNKMDITTGEMGAGFPRSLKLRNQISGSKEGKEPNTGCCP
jgi:hypothetical protein